MDKFSDNFNDISKEMSDRARAVSESLKSVHRRVKEQMNKKKVLKIINEDGVGEFLMNVYDNRIETTHDIKNAVNILDLNWNVIQQITKGLKNLGYQLRIEDGK